MEKIKIGENAGKIWHLLNETTSITMSKLCQRLGISLEEAVLAVGWLARENKIYIEKKEGILYLSNESNYNFTFG